MRVSVLAVAVAAGLAGGPALAQQASGTQPYGQEVRLLIESADALREAAQTAAGAQGEHRNEAIAEVNDALMEAKRAMAALPPEAMTAEGSTVDAGRTMTELQQAAQRLRDAAQAIADQEPGEARNEAIRAANDALLETQQAMVDLMPETAAN